MQQKYPILVFLFLILASGCTSALKIAQEGVTVTPLKATTSSEGPLAATAAPPVHTDTPDPKSIPRQNDLIFIEFFAGT
jgi:hypothetical protein